MADGTIKILYIDQTLNNLDAFKAYFRREGAFSITTSISVEDALLSNDFHVMVIDHGLLNTAIAILKKLDGTNSRLVKILVTSNRDLQNEDVFRCHYKPFDFEDLRKSIEEAYQEYLKD